MRVFPLFFFLAFTGVLASAQNGINIDSIKSRYSRYNAVVTRLEFHYVFDIVRDSLTVRQDNIREVLILNDHLKAFSNDNIYYGSFSSLEDIEAYTMVPKGKSFEKIDVTRFNETHDRDGQIFYDDSKTISFVYPSITDGALTSLKYSVIYNNPRFLNRSYFQSYIPVISAKVTVRVNKDIKLGYRLFNDESVNLKHRHYSKGNYDYYVWEANDVPPYKYLNSSYYNILYHSPHLSLFAGEIKTNGKVRKFYSTVDELYRFNYGLLSGMNTSASDELKSLVEKITHGLDDWEKAKAIYYWVQDNIKYIAYSDGYMGFIPVPPSEVFAKRFGDCKGMASLIKKMMDLAGLPAYLSWVGTRSIPYTYEELPLPSADNHMVTSYLKGDTTIIMDGTFKHLDFGMYPYHIQGKEVLIGIDDDEYHIFKVPVSHSSISTVYDSVTISLSGKTITGKGKRVHTGFNRVELATAMDGVKETDYSKSFTALFQKGNNKFKVDTAQVINLFEHDKPATVCYDFILEDYSKVLDDEIYLNLNLDKTFQNSKIDTAIQYSPVVNDFCYNEKHITRFEIPSGYEIKYLPEGDTFSNDNFRATFKYHTEDGCVVLEKALSFNFLLLPVNRISEWNSFIDQLNKNYRLSLVLGKTNNQ